MIAVVHHTKAFPVFAEAWSAVLPYVRGMSRDCSEWRQATDGKKVCMSVGDVLPGSRQCTKTLDHSRFCFK